MNQVAEIPKRLREIMLHSHLWFAAKYDPRIYEPENTDYKKVVGKKYISLGKSLYYGNFAKRMTEELDTPSYLLDYMLWINPDNPYSSLLYYIYDASRIDINLEGIELEDLRKATIESKGPAADRKELGLQQMTCWEINRVFHCEDLLYRTYWHVDSEIKYDEICRILESKVSKKRIIKDYISNSTRQTEEEKKRVEEEIEIRRWEMEQKCCIGPRKVTKESLERAERLMAPVLEGIEEEHRKYVESVKKGLEEALKEMEDFKNAEGRYRKFRKIDI